MVTLKMRESPQKGGLNRIRETGSVFPEADESVSTDVLAGVEADRALLRSCSFSCCNQLTVASRSAIRCRRAVESGLLDSVSFALVSAVSFWRSNLNIPKSLIKVTSEAVTDITRPLILLPSMRNRSNRFLAGIYPGNARRTRTRMWIFTTKSIAPWISACTAPESSAYYRL